MKNFYLWFIRTKERRSTLPFLPERFHYSATQKAPKNKFHLTPFWYQARDFKTKKEAQDYFYLKVRNNVDMSNCTIVRKKCFVKNKKYDFWRMTEAFR